jgi:hypothetical protein
MSAQIIHIDDRRPLTLLEELEGELVVVGDEIHGSAEETPTEESIAELRRLSTKMEDLLARIEIEHEKERKRKRHA